MPAPPILRRYGSVGPSIDCRSDPARRTRITGEIIRKFVAYGRRIAIVGDISRYLDESSALRDFLSEFVWLMANLEESATNWLKTSSVDRSHICKKSLRILFVPIFQPFTTSPQSCSAVKQAAAMLT
jgi:hypothetical protein